MPNATSIALIPLLPFAGFVLLGLFGRKYLKNYSGLIGTALLLTSAALAFYTAYDYFFVAGKVNGVYQTAAPSLASRPAPARRSARSTSTAARATCA